jgi:hypothetical protein
VYVGLIILVFCLAIFASLILFNLSVRPGRESSLTTQALENQGLVTAEEFKVRRALQVEEFEDEGSHFFLELNDGNVLFLSGQYLYDYAPVDDIDPEQGRLFPCSEFTVKRHKDKGYVIEITRRVTYSHQKQ